MRKQSFLAAVVCLCACAYADNPTSVIWSTFLGGNDEDINQDLIADVNGDIYVCGTTRSADFPTTVGAYDTTFNGGTTNEYGGDTWVAKIDGVTGQLVYSTFLGGPDDEEPDGIYVNASGEVLVLGTTSSPSFPTTAGAYDQTQNGGSDVFLLKLSADGSTVLWSTFLGGSGDDEAWEKTRIGLDASGNVYVTGLTQSADFPTTSGAFDETHNGPNDGSNASRDGFVAKFSSDGSSLLYSTFIGGSDRDQGLSLHTTASGEVYLTGFTFSTDFPTTTGAFDETFNAGRDNFVLKLNAAGSALVYSTYIGGSASDSAWDIVVDTDGNAYITGNTGSDDYPTTPGAFQTVRGVTSNVAIVTELNAAGSALVASTLLGGPTGGGLIALSLDRDAGGNIWIGGQSSEPDLPTTPLAYLSNFQGGPEDSFVAQFDPTLGSLKYCSYVGGTGDDIECHVAVDGLGNVLLGGRTLSSDFPTSVGAADSTFGGDGTTTGESYAMKIQPGTIQVHYLALFDAEMEALYNSISEDYLTADLDADGMPDHFQVGLVAYVLSVQTHPYSNLVHDLYASTITSLQGESNYAAQIQPYHHAVAALMICSQAMADYWSAYFSTSGSYSSFVITKTTSEPFSAQGDLDGDGIANVEEYQNNLDTGGDLDSFLTAATDPALNGLGMPAMGGLAVVACVLLLLAAGRRRLVLRRELE